VRIAFVKFTVLALFPVEIIFVTIQSYKAKEVTHR